jgi:hypothetical protein
MAATFDEPAAARLECLRTAMRGLEGQIVSVRVVSDSKNLVVVFRGTLCPPSDDKHPALFWPVDEEPSTADHAAREKPGIYLHPDLLEDVIVHTGEFVVEFGRLPSLSTCAEHRRDGDSEAGFQACAGCRQAFHHRLPSSYLVSRT